MLAFKLLDTTGLNVKDKELALTACPSLTFDNMKAALKRISGDNMPQRGAGKLQVSGDAADAAYYTRFTSRRKSRSNSQNQTAVQSTNTLGRYGRRTRCTVCQSIYHWVKDCPHRNIKTCKTNRRWRTDWRTLTNATLLCCQKTQCLTQRLSWWGLWNLLWLTQLAPEQCVEKNGLIIMSVS